MNSAIELFESSLSEWWKEEFKDIDWTEELFTPPQKKAIPLIHKDKNVLIAAPTGSGKCVTQDTPIPFLKNGKMEIKTAKDILDHTKNKIFEDSHGKLYSSDIESFSFDGSDITKRKSAIYKEKYSGDIYKIKTKDGRKVKITPDHPLLVNSKNNIDWKKAKNIKESDKIGIPKKISLPVEKERFDLLNQKQPRSGFIVTYKKYKEYIDCLDGSGSLDTLDKRDLKNILALLEITEEIRTKDFDKNRDIRKIQKQDIEQIERIDFLKDKLEELSFKRNEVCVLFDGGYSFFRFPDSIDKDIGGLYGFILSQGKIKEQEKTIVLDKKPSIDLDISKLLKTKFGLDFYEDRNKIIIEDTGFVSFLSSLFNLSLENKHSRRLPSWILNCPSDVKHEFLSVYVNLEAREENLGVGVEIENKIMAEQLNYLFLSFGILTIQKPINNDCRVCLILNRKDLSILDEGIKERQTIGPNRLDGPHRLDTGLVFQDRYGVDDFFEYSDDKNIGWVEIDKIKVVDYSGLLVDLSVPRTNNFVGGFGGFYMHNTLASFSSIINELLKKEKNEGLQNSVYCLYVSPLKSLANDIHRNLEVPLLGIEKKEKEKGRNIDIRHAIRHGDTTSYEKQKMLDDTPHILNTTPETLGILLNSPKFREKLNTIQWVIVDEIHALANNKRGTHLSVSLERLEDLVDGSFVRIGCSATVEPLDEMARFLVGWNPIENKPRSYEVVDTRFVRDFDIELKCPSQDLINTSSETINKKFYRDLDNLIENHSSTLIFTNTRSGAERILHNLRDEFPDRYGEDNSGCHHGSLGKESRKKVEEGLKSGDMKVVTSSTSLELGVDFSVELVVQIGSPKSVSSLLQRIGRAGHTLGETVKGRIIALDRDELLECSVMLKKAQEGFIDRVFIPENSQDVLAQHVYGMTINDVCKEKELVETIKSAYPYRDYTEDEWSSLLRYLKADYEGLEERNIYAKIWEDEQDGEKIYGSRGRMARPIYMTNIGTIPDEFSCDVFIRGSDKWVGDLDEGYLDKLQKGDVFVLGGKNYKFRYRRGSKVYVDRTNEEPTVPSWFSERLPLSYDLGKEILNFKQKMIDKIKQNKGRQFLSPYPIDKNSLRSILQIFDEQLKYTGQSGISTNNRFVVEQIHDEKSRKRKYYFHSVYGRKFNDGLSRMVAYEFSRRTGKNVKISIADNGFVISIPDDIGKVNLYDIFDSLDPENAREKLKKALDGTELLKRYFRINATRSLMILKNYKGYEKTAKRQQVDSDMLLGIAQDFEDFAVLEETYRECMEDKLDIGKIENELKNINEKKLELSFIETPTPSPMAFGLAALSSSDVVLAEDRDSVIKQFHNRVMEEIQKTQNKN